MHEAEHDERVRSQEGDAHWTRRQGPAGAPCTPSFHKLDGVLSGGTGSPATVPVRTQGGPHECSLVSCTVQGPSVPCDWKHFTEGGEAG